MLGILAAVCLMLAEAMRRQHDHRTAPPAEANHAVDLKLEVSGCAALRVGPVCELPEDGILRVWVSSPPAAVTFATNVGPVEWTALRTTEDGTLERVVVQHTEATELRVLGGNGGTAAIHLARKSAPSWFAEASAARRTGNVALAEKAAHEHEGSLDPAERALALGLRARLELAAGRQEASFPLFRESARLHRAAGRISDAADDSFALAFALNQRSHHYAEAHAVLDDVHTWVGPYADGRVRESYYRGTLASETGDARSALRLLDEARERASRIGLAALERNAINAYAMQLELLGRANEARAMLQKLATLADAADTPPCEKVEIFINLGFGTLLANAQRHDEKTALDDAAPLLDRALSVDGCTDVYLQAAALGNLAVATLERGDPAGARRVLQRARANAVDRGVEHLFWHDLDGRIALAQADGAAALRAFESEAHLADSMLSFEAGWRAELGKGEALERLGRNDAALESYHHAERLLSAMVMNVPLGEGRGTFVGDRSRSARLAVDLLVRLRRPDEALAVARASRARVLAGLEKAARLEGLNDLDRVRWENAIGAYRDARTTIDAEAKDDWKLPRDEVRRARASRQRRENELRAALDNAFAVLGASAEPEDRDALPAKSEDLTVVYHPIRKGWVGLVATGGVVTSFAFDEPSNADLARTAEHLLAPMRSRLEAARRLHVLAYGSLRGIDFHALPFDGQPLATRIPVEYPLDLPLRRSRPVDGKPIAVVVSDPTLDLASARKESEDVVRSLRSYGTWDVTLLGGSQATTDALRPLLGRATLLHYAGHSVFAGREGWQSALPLAAGGHLALSDVLAARAVPQRVVLSSCEAARSSQDAAPESLGLSQAFVIAGADFVISPARLVDDHMAARLSAALYGGLAESGPVDAAAVLRDAQLRLRAEVPDADWSAFRVIRR